METERQEHEAWERWHQKQARRPKRRKQEGERAKKVTDENEVLRRKVEIMGRAEILQTEKHDADILKCREEISGLIAEKRALELRYQVEKGQVAEQNAAQLSVLNKGKEDIEASRLQLHK